VVTGFVNVAKGVLVGVLLGVGVLVNGCVGVLVTVGVLVDVAVGVGVGHAPKLILTFLTGPSPKELCPTTDTVPEKDIDGYDTVRHVVLCPETIVAPGVTDHIV